MITPIYYPRVSTSLRRVIQLATGTAILLAGLLVAPASAVAAGAGSITGQLTDAGAPVPGASVSAVLSVYPVAIATTVTAADGTFRLDNVPAGLYKVRFTLLGGLAQFYPGQTDFAAATVITLTDQQVVTIADSVIAHGSVAGRITTALGAPATHALVGITHTDSSLDISHVSTDENGDYLFPYVAGGAYRLFVSVAERGAPQQWVHQHKRFADADNVAVAVGQRSTVDEALLPLGTISGRLTNAAGPVANAVVFGYSQASSADDVAISTGTDGTFRLWAYPGAYKVKFQAPAGVGLDQWASGKESEAAADIITVTADNDTVLNERQLPTGTVAGRLTDADGQPVAFAAAVVVDPATDRDFDATTDADGRWFLTAWTGTYQVRFETETQVQWAHGALSPDAATRITVAEGQTTTVDEALVRTGSLTVSAVDAQTGAALQSFCASAHRPYMFLLDTCTDSGTVTFPSVGPGTYTVEVTDGVHLNGSVAGVRVTSGGSASATVTMVQGATIDVSIVDGTTGAPVDACVNARQTTRAPSPGEGVGDCSYDGSGHVTISRIKSEPYALFASPFDGVHGAQWVGPRGGVGMQNLARVVDPAPGGTVKVTVRLDLAGSIAGTVTDRATGAPIAGADISAWGAANTTDSTGHYVLDGLGPYQWNLFTSQPSYAGQYSTPVRVRAGQQSTYSVALSAGTTISGQITSTSGRLPEAGTVSVVSARTFDELARVEVGTDGRYTAHVLAPIEVLVLAEAEFHGCFTDAWRPGTLFVRAPTTVDFSVAELCPL